MDLRRRHVAVDAVFYGYCVRSYGLVGMVLGGSVMRREARVDGLALLAAWFWEGKKGGQFTARRLRVVWRLLDDQGMRWWARDASHSGLCSIGQHSRVPASSWGSFDCFLIMRWYSYWQQDLMGS